MSDIEAIGNLRAASPWLQLPEFEPDPALWSRIQSARSQLLRRRQRKRWLAVSLAAAALLCVAIVSRVQLGLSQSEDVAFWQEHSQSLEQEWLAMSRSTPDPRARTELRLIDLELQTAYDRGATEGELIPLWKLRNEALRELIDSNGSRQRSVTRI